MPTESEPIPPSPDQHDVSPPLARDRSFWGMTITQFLGAFNDNLFKQLILLLSLSTGVAAIAAGGRMVEDANPADTPAAAVGDAEEKPKDRQTVAMALFSIPFLLFSGVAGFLSDKVSKRTVIVAAKVAEIFVMALGLLAFSMIPTWGLTPALAVLFAMGLQSAFFGPAKYGILPELFRPTDLPAANAVMLMTTFLAIIFGTAAAGVILDYLAGPLWVRCGLCLVIAVIGTATSLLVRPVPAAKPGLELEFESFHVPRDTRQMLGLDRPLCVVLFVSSVFWLIGGLVQPSVNAFGKNQLGVADSLTSLLAASMGVGIAFGCVVAGILCRGQPDFRLTRVGAAGVTLCLLLMSLPALGGWGDIEHNHLLGYYGSIVVLILVGGFAGLFVIPLQVFMQLRPPVDRKGRMIGVMNQASWLAIVISVGFYALFGAIVEALALPHATVFGFTALIILPVAVVGVRQ